MIGIGRWGWLFFIGFGLGVLYFGLEVLFWTPQGFQDAGNVTEGVLAIPRIPWGVGVVASGLYFGILGATSFRTLRRWAWYGAFYGPVYLVFIAAVEPDWIGTMATLGGWAIVMVLARPHFFPAKGVQAKATDRTT